MVEYDNLRIIIAVSSISLRQSLGNLRIIKGVQEKRGDFLPFAGQDVLKIGLLANKIQELAFRNQSPVAIEGKRQLTYGSDNSLNINFNAGDGFNLNNWNRSDQNWNLAALPEVSLFYFRIIES